MIRHATKYDIPILVDMVQQYAKEFPSELARQEKWFNKKYIQQLLMTLIAGRGFVLIDDDERGFLAALILQNLWYPELQELSEIAWWVKPEHRNGSVGGKLWVMYDKEANKLKAEGRIHYSKTTITVSSPDINYEKRGYKKLETTYLKE